ncbi:hypothetical protein CaCOL14_001001 [Colletotrichum acutatum]
MSVNNFRYPGFPVEGSPIPSSATCWPLNLLGGYANERRHISAHGSANGQNDTGLVLSLGRRLGYRSTDFVMSTTGNMPVVSSGLASNGL